MNLSFEVVKTCAEIVPLLLLATFLDRDVLRYIKTQAVLTKYTWLGLIGFMLIGEMLSVLGMVRGGTDGHESLIILTSVFVAIGYLFTIAAWRILGVNIISGLPSHTK